MISNPSENTPNALNDKFPANLEPTDAKTNEMTDIDDNDIPLSNTISSEDMDRFEKLRQTQTTCYECLDGNLQNIFTVVNDGSMIKQEQCSE